MNFARLVFFSAALSLAFSADASARSTDYFIGTWDCRGGTGASSYVVELRYKRGDRFSFDYAARIQREPVSAFGTGTWSTDRGRTITESIKSFNIDASKAVDLASRPPRQQEAFRSGMAGLAQGFKRSSSTDRVTSVSRNRFKRVSVSDPSDRMTCRRQRR
ncbi:MAG: hypothetical protein AAGF49_01775 [Pseudomonadota bacterium]